MMWREKLRAYLDGPRLARLAEALGRSPDNYMLDPANIEKLTDHDIQWFFRTLELQVLTELPSGDFQAPRSGAKERLYWHLNTGSKPVTVGVAMEPIITLGAVGRLVGEFGWPADCIGIQNGNWSFDLTGYASGTEQTVLQCEVKRDRVELDKMCDYLTVSLTGNSPLPPTNASQRKNWDRKREALLAQPPAVFWALGPGGHERIYRVIKAPGLSGLQLVQGSQLDLKHSAIVKDQRHA